MSQFDNLLAAYQAHVAMPWGQGVAHRQRVWIVVYPPEMERRLRRRIGEFEIATGKANHGWRLVDLDGVFERWLAEHKYREQYLADPSLLGSAMGRFAGRLADVVTTELGASGDDDVVSLLGVGTLFGLGEQVRASALIEAVSGSIRGRMVVFFPGSHLDNNYRLFDARDGWNYLAVPITADGGRW